MLGLLSPRAHFPVCAPKLWKACSPFPLRPPLPLPPLLRPDASPGCNPPEPKTPENKFPRPARWFANCIQEISPHSAAETCSRKSSGNFLVASLRLPRRHPNNRTPRAAAAAPPVGVNPQCLPLAAKPLHALLGSSS